jgi:hypothetical protein
MDSRDVFNILSWKARCITCNRFRYKAIVLTSNINDEDEQSTIRRPAFLYYDKEQERLISTGKFYAGDAVLMIEHMVKTGKIEKTKNYNIYKIGKLLATREGERNML